MLKHIGIEKIFSWFLILAGVLLIIWTLYFSYNIFTGTTPAPEIFKMGEEEVLSQEKENGDIQSQMGDMMKEQLKGLIPAESIPKLLNLVIWIMLATLLIFGSAQISNLGIKLIKK